MGQKLPLADKAYLKRRRGKNRSGYRWYVRINVPHDLQGIIRKRTLEHALNTSDFKEAQKLRHAVLARIHADFDLARRGVITSADIEHEAQRYLRKRLDLIYKNPGDAFEIVSDDDGNDVGLEGQAALWHLQDSLANQDWPDTVRSEAITIQRRYGTTIGAEQEDELLRVLLLAEIEALSRALMISRGEIPEQLSVLNARAVDPITAALRPQARLAPRQSKGLKVAEAGNAYITDRNRHRRGAWTGQTMNQSRATLRLFTEFSRDASLQTITRGDVAKFLSTIAQLDPNYGRRSATEKLTLTELLNEHTASDNEGLSNRTLNRHVATIAGMFEWAIRAGKFDGANPAKGHHRSKTEHDTDENNRRAFTTVELNKLLTGSLFSPPCAERVQPKQHTIETTLAWLIPIALFSGMRLDEICGLRTEHVRRERRVLYFDLQSHEGRRLKTAAARRLVPVHSELLRMGFSSYIAHIRHEGHEYLFPALKPGGPDNKRSWYASKRFVIYRRSLGVTAKETVFHCFRKNVATALERARVPENEAVQILGHKKMTMSYGLYSDGLDLIGLKRVVEAISYPGLDLSHQTTP